MSKKNKVGRPFTIDDKLLEKARHYIENFNTVYGDEIPTVAGLACELGVTRQTIHEWARNNADEEFSYIFKALGQSQERTLVNKGLTGKFSAAITGMILSKHGYSNAQKVDHSSSDGSMSTTKELTDQELEKKLAEYGIKDK